MKEERRIVRQIRADKQTLNFRQQGQRGRAITGIALGQAYWNTTQEIGNYGAVEKPVDFDEILYII